MVGGTHAQLKFRSSIMAKSSTYVCDFVIGNEKQQRYLLSFVAAWPSLLLLRSETRGGREEEFVNGRKREGGKVEFSVEKVHCREGARGRRPRGEKRLLTVIVKL